MRDQISAGLGTHALEGHQANEQGTVYYNVWYTDNTMVTLGIVGQPTVSGLGLFFISQDLMATMPMFGQSSSLDTGVELELQGE